MGALEQREPRRVLFVTPSWVDAAGGAEAHLKALARRLASIRGFEVQVATTCVAHPNVWANELPPGRFVDGDMIIHRFPVQSFSRAARAILGRAVRTDAGRIVLDRLGWEPVSLRSPGLRDFVRENRSSFDGIIAAAYGAGVAIDAIRAAPERAIFVPCLHDEPQAYLKRTGELLRLARHRFFNTTIERELALRIHGADAAEGPVVGIGIEPPNDVMAETDVRKEFQLSGDYLAYVGRLVPSKGVDRIVAAVKRHNALHPERSVKLVLAGGGPWEPPRDPFIRKLPYLPERMKNGLLAAALANISFSRLESLSLVLLEAWSVGTPSITSSDCPVLDWQVRRSGGGISISSPDEFSAALKQLRDPIQRASMAQAGARLLQNEYRWDRVLTLLSDVLRART